MSLRNPSDILKIDKLTNSVPSPTILLTTRKPNIIGNIKYTNWNLSLVGNGFDEITFDVYKPLEITNAISDKEKKILEYEHNIWDNLVDLKLIEVKGYGRFEIQVNYTDNEKTIKSVHGYSLEVELDQIQLRDFHVNDDEVLSSMEITEYNKDNFDENGNFIPTVFYDENDNKHSLLHRVLADKAPHWSIGYVTPYIALSETYQPELSSSFQRTYTCDGESIYSFLTGTVAEESNVIFVFDTLNRVINCYSLCDCIDQETGNVLTTAIGEDTRVFINKKKLANEITVSSNKDNVKNCFKIEGGDDIITSMINVVNTNGSNYIYLFDEFQLEDMSTGLVEKIKSYQKMLEEYREEYERLYLDLCKQYNFKYYYESSMMPGVSVNENGEIIDSSLKLDNSTAEEEYDKMITAMKEIDYFVAVQSEYTSTSFVGVTNNVIAMAQILLDYRFKVDVVGTPSYNPSTNIWEGKFRIYRTSDESEFYPTIPIDEIRSVSITINNNEIGFVEQKIEKALNKADMLNIKLVLDESPYTNSDGSLNTNEIENYFNQYSLNRLKSFYDGYETCLSVLMEMGQKDDGTDEKAFYDKYITIRNIVGEAKEQRQQQVDSTINLINKLLAQQTTIQNTLNFEAHLGEYYTEFCSYRREDTYSNSNYISDGLTDAQCIDKAKELLAVANKEISKACVLQRTVSTSLNNLFALPEFESLYDSFNLFNYIRLETDDEILKLRLIGIDYNGNSTSEINVTFSEQIESVDGTYDDLRSILNQANSMVDQFPATIRQAKQGSEARDTFVDMYNNGLNTALTLIKNSDSNEVTYGPFGILCKNMGDEGNYGQKQLRVIGNGIYLSDDDWQTVRMALGEVNIGNNEYYGVLADVLVGKLIAGQQLHISNEDGSVEITGDGIVINNGTISWAKDGSGVNLPEISMEDLEGLEEFTESINKSIADLQSQIDGEVTSWFKDYTPTTSNEPASLWITEEEKIKHEGDLFYNTATGEVYRYVYSSNTSSHEWITVTDTSTAEALEKASKAQDTADSKRRVFYTTPTPPYDKGDLWAQGTSGELMICTNPKKDGESYNANDWTKAVKYTDDTALNTFINGEYADDLTGINNQIDRKARSWYQTTDPSKTWDTSEDHEGDLWYNSSANSQVTYIYNNGAWKATNVPKELFDTIDGIASIYVTVPDNPVTGDLLIPTSDSGSYKANKVYKYNGSTWVEINYTDDTVANQAKDIANTAKELGDKLSTNLGMDFTTKIGDKYVVSPVIAGGYLLIGNKNGVYAEINTNGVLTATGANITGAINATSLTLGNGVYVSANKVSGLSTVATSGKYSDLSEQPTIPTKLSDLTDGKNVMKTDDIKVTTSTKDGITTTKTTVGSNTYTTYTSADGSYLLTNLGVGTDLSGKDYFKVDTNGLLKARNALIYGTIYATSGKFTGTVEGSTIVGGELKSTNYVKDTTGSYLNLNNGDFEFGGGNLTYSNNVITLGKKNTSSIINLCGNSGSISYVTNDSNYSGEYLKIKSDGNFHITSSTNNLIRIYNDATVGGSNYKNNITLNSQEVNISSANTTTDHRAYITVGSSYNSYSNINLSADEINIDGSIKFYDVSENKIEVLRLNAEANPILIIGDGLYSSKSGKTHISSGTAVGLLTSNNRVYLENNTGSTSYNAQFRPLDGKVLLGTSAYKWYAVYSANATIQTSDVREKENIIPLGTSPIMELSLDEKQEQVDIHSELFDRLQPVQYNYINGEGRICYGLVAQQVVEAMEEIGIEENELDLVHHDFWTDEETGEGKDSYGLAYANLIAMLIHEVQKLKISNTELKNRLLNL